MKSYKADEETRKGKRRVFENMRRGTEGKGTRGKGKRRKGEEKVLF